MSWWSRLFGRRPQAVPSGEAMREMSGRLIVGAYRDLAKQRGLAPTDAMSDEEILAIYSAVLASFRGVAAQRGEHLPIGIVNFIALKFFQVREMSGPEFAAEHLRYEVDKYLREGLRPDYRQELKLFPW